MDRAAQVDYEDPNRVYRTEALQINLFRLYMGFLWMGCGQMAGGQWLLGEAIGQCCVQCTFMDDDGVSGYVSRVLFNDEVRQMLLVQL